MKYLKKSSSIVMMLAAATAFVSCSHNDDFDENYVEKQKKAEFAANFVKKYGEVDANQSWDFTNDLHTYSLSNPNKTQAAATRAVTVDPAQYLKINDWYEVDLNTVNWMTSTLKNAENHETLGSPFYMVVPNNEFFIVPIFEGYADFIWTLHIVVEDYDDNGENLDLTVWTKHQNIEQKTKNSPIWNGITAVKGHTQDATELRAKPIEIDLTSFKGKKMHLYLENKKYKDGELQPRNDASSLGHTMLALNIPAESMPSNIDESYKKMIIACEDQAIYEKSDHDYNDIVFMIYGKPDIPDVKELEEPIYDSFSKRYMIEDLGSTDDFDFNDVVVDVYNIVSKTAVYKLVEKENEKGEKVIAKEFVSFKDEQSSQKAIIRCMGGTLDFTLKVGNATWTKSESKYPVNQMLNTGANGPIDYNAVLAEFPVTGWDSDANNVSVTVGTQQSGDVKTISFPKTGEVPMILAFDPYDYRNWMNERQSIPAEWFTVAGDDDEEE